MATSAPPRRSMRAESVSFASFGEALMADDATQLRDRHGVRRCELDGDATVVETHLRVVDAVQLLHGHAHGVGADASVHAENGLVDGLKLSFCGTHRHGGGGKRQENRSEHEAVL